jgi:hypothetical protein
MGARSKGSWTISSVALVTAMGILSPLSALAQPLPEADAGAERDAASTPPGREPFTAPPPPGPYTPPGAVPPPPISSAPPPPAPPPAPPPPTRPAGYDAEHDPDPRVENAHADRVMLLPTGYTHPAGTVYLSTYDIALLQAGYAISDAAQISLTGSPPLGDDQIFPLDLSLKVVVHRDRYVRVAGIGAVTGLVGLEEGNFLL